MRAAPTRRWRSACLSRGGRLRRDSNPGATRTLRSDIPGSRPHARTKGRKAPDRGEPDWSDLGTRLGLESVLEAAEESSTILYPVRLSDLRTMAQGGPSRSGHQRPAAETGGRHGGRNLEVDADHPLEALLEQIRQELHATVPAGLHATGDGGRPCVPQDRSGCTRRRPAGAARAGYDHRHEAGQRGRNRHVLGNRKRLRCHRPAAPNLVGDVHSADASRLVCGLFNALVRAQACSAAWRACCHSPKKARRAGGRRGRTDCGRSSGDLPKSSIHRHERRLGDRGEGKVCGAGVRSHRCAAIIGAEQGHDLTDDGSSRRGAAGLGCDLDASAYPHGRTGLLPSTVS